MIAKQNSQDNQNQAFQLVPLDFKEHDELPKQFNYENENLIPRFKIHNVPPQAKSLALIMEDTDTPGSNHIHWILYNIDPAVPEIGGKIHPGKTGKNSWTMKAYQGANPIRGKHVYRFSLFALDTPINMEKGYKSKELKKEIEDQAFAHIYVEAYSKRSGSFALE